MIVVLGCPECGRQRCYNGRGRCRCGAYLIDHADWPVYIAEGNGPYYLHRDGEWEKLSD